MLLAIGQSKLIILNDNVGENNLLTTKEDPVCPLFGGSTVI